MRGTITTRFFSKVKKLQDCWVWTASCFRDGYGQIKVNKKNLKAHRLSWILHNPDMHIGELCVLHKCDNRLCVNPSHLFLGTPADNVIDRDNKMRQVKGVLVNTNKLSELSVIKIRELYKTGKITQVELARQFNIDQTGISNIINNKTWKHL